MYTSEARSNAARIGVTLLNLPAPGLGLIRVGATRLGLVWTLLPFLVVAAVLLAASTLPAPGFTAYAALVLLLLAASLAWMIAAMVATWRRSREPGPARWWNRWYGLLGLYIVSAICLQLLVVLIHGYYKPFFAPSESMVPTLLVGDNFLVDMHDRTSPRRGDLVLVAARDGPYIKRVAAIGGDRVAMRGGVPSVNGVAVAQVTAGTMTASFIGGDTVGRVAREMLPGENGSHRVLDLGDTQQDEVPETIVPAGSIFVLGDNRDNSEDSRFPREIGGLGMVPLGDVTGRPLFIYWSSDRSRIGTRLKP